ncbi:hypothetical protein HRbin36_00584 [bacterium HR36]|nr:hypothetical protein HRbin36_00584 [bacterium HR36]
MEIANVQLDNVALQEWGALPAIVWITATGVPVDMDELQRQLRETEAGVARLWAEMTRLVQSVMRSTFNPNSYEQIIKCFAQLGFPITKAKAETLHTINHPLAE